MIPYISSRHNPAVMLAASLSDKKNREKNRLFRFDGKKLLAGLLKACEKRPVSIETIERIVDEIETTLQILDYETKNGSVKEEYFQNRLL